MATVLPVAGSNVRPAEADSVVKLLPSVLPRIDSVWVRVDHAASGGSFSVTLPMLVAAPRSTCTHCGKALLALSQYVEALPSVTVAGACVALTWLLAVAGRPAAMLVVLSMPLPESATVAGVLLALL